MKMVMQFGTWNFMSPYRASTLKTVADEMARYNLDITGSARGQMG
jgi:hypothetical protein